MDTAQVIRERRAAPGMSPYDLASAAGIDVQQIQDYETARQEPCCPRPVPRFPGRSNQMLQARQRKTLTVFEERNNRLPTPEERALIALFPAVSRNRDCRHALSYNWFHKGFKAWVDSLDIGAWVPHQARHSLATSLLRAGASLAHIRSYLGQVSDKMAERYVHLAHSDLEEVLQQVWVTGPGSASPGELLTGTGATPLSREQALNLAIDLSRRATPAEGGFCTFQPVVDGGACPWNLYLLTEQRDVAAAQRGG